MTWAGTTSPGQHVAAFAAFLAWGLTSMFALRGVRYARRGCFHHVTPQIHVPEPVIKRVEITDRTRTPYLTDYRRTR
jgi:hypothetical protein